MTAWRKMLVIAIALIASVAAIASGSESEGGSGSSKDSGASAAANDSADSEKTAAGDADEVDDVKVNTCGKDDLGFANANITVTNNSSDPSDYLIEITFASKDGKTQVGTGNSIISNLANGQSKTEDVSALEDAGTIDFVCTVSKVDRYSSN